MKNLPGYFLLESLLISIIWVGLLVSLISLFHFQERIQQHFQNKAFVYRQLMGFEALFSQWMKSFSTLACLYPLESDKNTLFLHGLPIWRASSQQLQFYTGRLQLVTETQLLPEKSWVLHQDGPGVKKPPYWLYVYDKHVLKFKDGKIYLSHDGHTQMLLEGLKGLQIQMNDGVIELQIHEPHFFKRYRLCQNLKMDLR